MPSSRASCAAKPVAVAAVWGEPVEPVELLEPSAATAWLAMSMSSEFAAATATSAGFTGCRPAGCFGDWLLSAFVPITAFAVTACKVALPTSAAGSSQAAVAFGVGVGVGGASAGAAVTAVVAVAVAAVEVSVALPTEHGAALTTAAAGAAVDAGGAGAALTIAMARRCEKLASLKSQL